MANDGIEVREWLEARKQEALKIDPENAGVMWRYTQTFDPYGVDPNLPDELRQVGREYFACRPGSDIWAWFGDLTDETREKLWKKHIGKLAFPAGLGGTRYGCCLRAGWMGIGP